MQFKGINNQKRLGAYILVPSATRLRMSLTRSPPSVSPTTWPKETEALGTRMGCLGHRSLARACPVAGYIDHVIPWRVQFSLRAGFCRPFSSPPALPLGLLGFFLHWCFCQCDGCLFLSFGVGAHGWVALFCQSWGHYFNLGASCQ